MSSANLIADPTFATHATISSDGLWRRMRTARIASISPARAAP
jgi:hypothetical protein